MPHILLEYSGNLRRSPNIRALFADLHEAILPMESIDVAHLKSRAVRHDEVYIGDGDAARSFVHLQLQLLSGRDQSVRQRLAKECMRVLEGHCGPEVTGEACQLSVEVREMERSTYVKQASLNVDSSDSNM